MKQQANLQLNILAKNELYKSIHKTTLCLFTLLCLLLSTTILAKVNHLNDQVKANKVLFVISSDQHGFWLPEVLEPYQLLQQAGYDIDIASPLGGQGKASGTFRLSSKQKTWLKQSDLLPKLDNSYPIEKLNAMDYKAIYFAGGAGPMFDFIENKTMQQLTADIYQNGGIVSADCHGSAALLNVKLANGERLIKGRKLTTKANSEEGRWARFNYPFLLEDKISELGGNYIAKAKGQENVVVDGRLITGQNPASAIPMAQQLILALSQLKR